MHKNSLYLLRFSFCSFVYIKYFVIFLHKLFLFIDFVSRPTVVTCWKLITLVITYFASFTVEPLTYSSTFDRNPTSNKWCTRCFQFQNSQSLSLNEIHSESVDVKYFIMRIGPLWITATLVGLVVRPKGEGDVFYTDERKWQWRRTTRRSCWSTLRVLTTYRVFTTARPRAGSGSCGFCYNRPDPFLGWSLDVVRGD